MTALKLVQDLAHRGARLELQGGSFICRAARGVLSKQDRDNLVRLKPQILALLLAPSTAEPTPPTTRPSPMTWQQELATPEVSAILDTFWDRPKPALSAYIP